MRACSKPRLQGEGDAHLQAGAVVVAQQAVEILVEGHDQGLQTGRPLVSMVIARGWRVRLLGWSRV